jgi:tetratricopeptide (TPR) repeat protein
MHNPTFKRYSFTLLAAAVLSMAASAVCGGEQPRKFLAALRDQQYYDVALDYLELARNNPSIDKEFKEVIDYEAGVTLWEAAGVNRSLPGREKQLGEAKERFDKFLSGRGDHPLAPAARRYLARVLVGRGRVKVEMAAQPTRREAEKATLLSEARELYQQAAKQFAALEQAAIQTLKKFPPKLDDMTEAQKEAVEQARGELLETRLDLARIPLLLADTYPPGSAERKQHITQAAKHYKELYDKYSGRLAGLVARVQEARCYKELGEDKKALEALEEILLLPDDGELRDLKNEAVVVQMEVALLPKLNNYDMAVETYQKWASTARPIDENSREGMAIKFLAAKAYLGKAKSGAGTDRERAKLLVSARKLLENVARVPGEHQSEAKSLLSSKEFVGEQAELGEPTNFAEANQRAREALEEMARLDSDLRDEQDAAKKKELEQQLVKARKDALRYYQLALQWRPDDLKIDDLNDLRYFLAYLYWAEERYHEACVVAEFIAKRYPQHSKARSAARLALSGYGRLFNAAMAAANDPDLNAALQNPDTPKDRVAQLEAEKQHWTQERQFASDRMVAIADYIANRWSGEPDADEGWMTLLRVAVINRDVEQTLAYLAKIPLDSGRRGEAELLAGQALWRNYLEVMREPEEQRPPESERKKMVAEARKVLDEGLARMRKAVEAGAPVTYTVASAALSLAQIEVAEGRAEQAVKLLQDPKLGPLTLVHNKDPLSTQNPNFTVETYKAALQSYVGVRDLDRAEQIVEELEAAIAESGDSEAGRRLTTIYIQLGRDLQEQLERLRSEKRNEQIEQVSKGFELFLTKISQRDKGNTFSSLLWVAETFNSLGQGFDTGGATLTAEARNYYEKAADTYRRILLNIDKPEFKAPANSTDAIKVRLARTLRKLGQFKEALSLLYSVLKERPNMVEAQFEAAYTYQAWGEQRPPYYGIAISGSQQYKEIWGWSALSRKLIRSPQHSEAFHEARYNLNLCLYQWALKETEAAAREKKLNQSKNDIQAIARLFPQMGGREWYNKYNDLYKKIQKALGEKVTGLPPPAKDKPAAEKVTAAG